MPAIKVLQRCSNIAGTARSYGVLSYWRNDRTRRTETRKISKQATVIGRS